MHTPCGTLGTLPIAASLMLTLAGCGPQQPEPQPPTDKEERLDWFDVDDFSITVHPDEAEFEDLVEVVDTFHDALPPDIAWSVTDASREQLRAISSWTYLQDVVEYTGEDAQQMGVELTMGLVEVPYDDLIAIMPPGHWGLNLAHYLGGELLPMEGIDGGQYERMVLSSFDCDIDIDLVNNDMTKAEIVRHEADRAEVYWRVYHSDNDTTDSDVGSVSFERYDDGSTLVTFHSAHVIRGLGGLIPLLPSDGWIIEDAMFDATSDMFTDFIAGYQVLVEDQYVPGDDSEDGVASYEQTVAEDEWHHYGPFSVAESRILVADLYGDGDADLYVLEGGQPDHFDWDCRPFRSDSEEICEVDGPGPVYVSVYGYEASSYTLDVTW